VRLAAVAAACALLAPASSLAETSFPDWLRIEQRPGASSELLERVSDVSAARVAKLTELDHPYVEILRRHEIHWEDHRTLIARDITVRRLLTEEGIREHGNLVRSVRSRVGQATLEEAWVRQRDGRIQDFEPDTLQIVSDSDPDVFSDIEYVVFPFSKLEVGTTIVLVTSTRMDLREWPLLWSRLFYSETNAPTESFEVVADWDPAVTQAPLWATDDPGLPCEESAGRIACERRAVPAIAMDPEVSWGDLVPQLIFTEPGDWAGLVRRERQLVLEAADSGGGLDEAAKRLRLAWGTERERLERIHRFVANEIRYVAFEHGTSSVTPHPAGRTLARRYGDCKDKVALFLALAKRADIDAYPVLVATERYATEKLILPSWLYFDHMIACVDASTGPDLCIDLTDPHAATGSLPTILNGAVALELRPDASGPSNLPQLDYAWRIQVEATNEFDCNGGVVERLLRRFEKGGAATMRGLLAGLTSTERERWLEDDYHGVMGDAVDPAFSVHGLRESGEDLILDSTTRFDGDGSIDEMSEWTESDAWLERYTRSFRTSNRHHPYRLNGLHVTATNRYRLCGGARFGFLGPRLELRSEMATLERRYEDHGNGDLTVTTDLYLPSRLVGTEEIERFNEFIDRLLDQTRIWFSIENGESGSPENET